jgi:DNA-3-methyladenine glycosylase II
VSLQSSLRKYPLPYDAQTAQRHVARADPIMRDVIKRAGPFALEIRGQPYQSLLRAILYQQLAGAAAAAIERRFLALFGGRVPSPPMLLGVTDVELRAVGLSRQKSGYMRSLAEHFASGELSDRKLRRAADDDVIAEVTKVKGIGRWTADMLLLFCLGRADVLPVGDYGIRASMRAMYRLPDLPTPAQMEEIARPWRPYRSAGTWYLWRAADMVTL